MSPRPTETRNRPGLARGLDALVVLVPADRAPPQRKPPYLRWTRYLVTRDAAPLAAARCPAEGKR